MYTNKIIIFLILVIVSKAAIDNCDTLGQNGSSEEICTQCSSNYIESTDQKTCYLKIQYCTDGQQTDDKCSQCDGGYHGNPSTDSTSCVDDIQNCSAYVASDTTQCETCGDTFYISPDKLICHPSIDNCDSQSSNICVQCSDNYHSKVDNTECYADVTNCETHNSVDPTLCESCTDEGVTYHLSEDKLNCYDFIANCSTQVDQTCNGCVSGYHLNTNTNDECIQNIPYCVAYQSADQSLCLTCSTDKTKSSDSLYCYGNISNCQTQEEAFCTQCVDLYHQNQNTTLCYPDIENCDVYDNDSDLKKCFTCVSDYHIADLITDSTQNGCYPNITECKTYSTTNNYHCAECNDGFFLTLDNYYCVLKVTNCQYYNDSRVCQQCKSGYHLDLANNSCVVNIKNCSTYSDSSSSVCTACNFGYKLENNICILNCEIEGCVTCKNLFQCDICSDGLTRSSSQYSCRKTCNVSTQTILHCDQCLSTECQTCSDQYYKNTDGLCYTCKEFGSSCSSCTRTKCNVCGNGNKNHIYSVNGHCLSCVQLANAVGQSTQKGCLECNFSSSKVSCLKCNEPYYYLVDNLCVSCSEIQNCEQCVSSKQCTQCKSTYYLLRSDALNQNSCGLCTTLNPKYKECKLLDNSDIVIPTQCQDTHYIDLLQKSEKCQPCIDFCLKCENNSTCLTCKDGYFKNNDTQLCYQENESEPVVLSNLTTLQEVYSYTQNFAKKMSSSKSQTYTFNINSVFNQYFCTISETVTADPADQGICVNGKCKFSYCLCDENYFGNVCQYNVSDQDALQSEFDELKAQIKLIIVNESNTYKELDNDQLINLMKMLQVLSELLRVVNKTQYQELNTLVTNIITNYGNDFESVDNYKYLIQIGLNFAEYLSQNTVISDSNKLTLEKSQYGQQIIDKVRKLIIQLIRRQENSVVQISYEKSKIKIYKDDISNPDAFPLIRSTSSSTSSSRRILDTDSDYADIQGFTTCTDEKLYSGQMFITKNDQILLKQKIFNQREGNDNVITISTMNMNQDKFIAYDEVDTSIYEVVVHDSNGINTSISNTEFQLFVKIPKKSLISTESISNFECKQWDSASKSWKNHYINTDNTKNCKNYVICQSTEFGAFAAIQESKITEDDDTEGEQEDQIIMAKEMFNQPGFIINLVLLLFFLLCTTFFCYKSESAPEKTKQKKIHMPELQQAYQQKLAMDHQKYLEEQENQKQGIVNNNVTDTPAQGIHPSQIDLQVSQNQQQQQQYMQSQQYQQQRSQGITMQPKSVYQPQQQYSQNQQQQFYSQYPGNTPQQYNNLNRSQNNYTQQQIMQSQTPFNQQKSYYNPQQTMNVPQQSLGNPQVSMYQQSQRYNPQQQYMNNSNNMQVQSQYPQPYNDQQMQQIQDTNQNNINNTDADMHTQENLQTMEQIKVLEEVVINPWMLHPIYSIYHTREINMRIMKLSLLLGTLQFYVLLLSIMFGYREVDHGVAVLFILLSMLFTWVFNYIWGFVACLFRNEEKGKNSIYSLYWLLFMFLYVGLTVGSIIACYNETSSQFNMIIIGFFVDILIDTVCLDLFVVFTLSQIHEESNDGFVKMTKILRFKGYYEEE